MHHGVLVTQLIELLKRAKNPDAVVGLRAWQTADAMIVHTDDETCQPGTAGEDPDHIGTFMLYVDPGSDIGSAGGKPPEGWPKT